MSPERRAQIEQERAMVEELGVFSPDGKPVEPNRAPVTELRRPGGGLDGSAIAGSVDNKPQGGLNPRYQPRMPPRRT